MPFNFYTEPVRIQQANYVPARPKKFDYVSQACETLGVSPHLIRSKSRQRTLVRVRWALAHVMRDSYGRSYPEIGNALNRDHTTMMHGVKCSRELVKTCKRHAILVEAMAMAA